MSTEKKVGQSDGFLQLLVDSIDEKPGTELRVTLLVEGFLVSGSLISGKEYFETLGERCATVFRDREFRAEVQDCFVALGETYRPPDGDSGIDLDKMPEYVHLRDARFFWGDGKPIAGNGALWRGRLSQVAGFNLGILVDADLVAAED